MIYNKRTEVLKQLSEENIVYLDELEKLDEKDKKDLYDNLKKSKKIIGYNSNDVKKSLKDMSRMRCPFCTKKINIDNKKNESDSLNFSVEHMIPKKLDYTLVLDWNNLVACCKRCNDFRGDKYDKKYYIDVTIDKNVDEYFAFNEKGEVIPCDMLSKDDRNKVKYMIDIYKLNKNVLKQERKNFMVELMQNNIIEESNIFLQNEIIFLDCYLYNRKVGN